MKEEESFYCDHVGVLLQMREYLVILSSITQKVRDIISIGSFNKMDVLIVFFNFLELVSSIQIKC